MDTSSLRYPMNRLFDAMNGKLVLTDHRSAGGLNRCNRLPYLYPRILPLPCPCDRLELFVDDQTSQYDIRVSIGLGHDSRGKS